MKDIVSLCKRRGFVFQSSEIYGGLNSCWDYGPLGISLKKNIMDLWWNAMTSKIEIEGLDSSILMASKVWEASGHVSNFTDPLVDCKECKNRFREDKVPKKEDGSIACPKCGSKNLTEARNFNLMFSTHMGALKDDSSVVYLRPETAQGIYVNFLNVATSCRKKVPFGIAQIGKAFRNEITPGNFIFRTREFEQMEMQFFVHPSKDEESFNQWKEERLNWHKSLGLNPAKLRFHAHGPKDLAHYAKAAFDIEYEFPFGWDEIEGIHNRTDFDLKRHQEFSGKNMHYVDPTRDNEKYIPYIIETSVGANRCMLTCLIDAYTEDKENDRIVLKLHPKLAPKKIAVFPLSKKPELEKKAKELTEILLQNHTVDYDTSGSIGKRYRRHDEIGTPLCITVDFDSLEDECVTIRNRDSMEQTRVKISEIAKITKDTLTNWKMEH